MNRYVLSILIAMLTLPIILFGNELYCSPQLQNCMNAIQQVPEAQRLISEIQKEGPIKIIVNNTPLAQQFGAYWDIENRTICIGMSPNTSKGSIIGSILFELHNASTTSTIHHYDNLARQGRVSRDKYVEAMEYMEYLNSINAAKIAEKGIAMGVFPHDARLPTYPNFKEHFAMQKWSGHSACFSRNYDIVTQQPQRCYRM